MVIWIIGLSGSGKTTILDKVYNEVSSETKNIVKIDGDIIREVFNNDLGHTIEHRKRNAKRISKLCQFLENQKIIVLCSILSAFEYDREWNRTNLLKYKEIYIKTPREILIERDSKGLYKKQINGEIDNVVGFDIPFEEPKNPDLVIENNGSKEKFLNTSNKIIDMINENV
jgi:cytidine diphosphoramidate kinase